MTIYSTRARAVGKNLPSTKQLELIKKCSEDAQFFIETFVSETHLSRINPTRIRLSKIQKDVLESTKTENRLIVKHPRGSRITSSLLLYFLWASMFTDSKILVVLRDHQSIHYTVATFDKLYDSLPTWLKSPILRRTTSTFEFESGARIEFVEPSTHAVLGKKPSHLWLSDFACYSAHGFDKQNDLWLSIAPLEFSLKQMIITSTPSTKSELFRTLWDETMLLRTPFSPLSFSYWDLSYASASHLSNARSTMPADLLETQLFGNFV